MRCSSRANTFGQALTRGTASKTEVNRGWKGPGGMYAKGAGQGQRGSLNSYCLWETLVIRWRLCFFSVEYVELAVPGDR